MTNASRRFSPLLIKAAAIALCCLWLACASALAAWAWNEHIRPLVPDGCTVLAIAIVGTFVAAPVLAVVFLSHVNTSLVAADSVSEFADTGLQASAGPSTLAAYEDTVDQFYRARRTDERSAYDETAPMPFRSTEAPAMRSRGSKE